MKTKIFSLILLTTILLAMTVSASLDKVAVSLSGDLTKSVDSVNLTITNNEAFNITIKTLTLPTISDGTNSLILNKGDFSGNISANGGTKVVAITRGAIPSGFKLGVFPGSISVYVEEATNSTNNNTKPATLTFANDFCKYGETSTTEGEKTISFSITDLEDRTIGNEDEWDWKPLDNIEFKVEISNDGTDKERVNVEYSLYNSNGKKVNLGGEDNEQSISINDGDSEKVIFALRVPADIDTDNGGDYRLFVKAYLKSSESKACADKIVSSYYQPVSISREEDRAVIVDMENLEIPELVQCGDSATISAKIYNTGIEDEDKVKVALYNKALGVDLAEVVNNLDSGESATFDFNFKVPENVEGKSYMLSLITYYEYDEDDDQYDSDSKSDLDKNFDFNLKVNCVKETLKSASITAELESDAIAGKPLTIKGTLKNTGDSETAYTLSVTGYTSWASLDKIDPSTITLKAGESKNFDISLNINEDVADEQFLTIKANYDGKTTEQEVSVTLEAAQGAVSGITGAAITENIKKNWFIWVIVVINIILIIAIIAVARRIVKSR